MDTELGFAHALESGAGLLHGRVEVFNVLQTHPLNSFAASLRYSE